MSYVQGEGQDGALPGEDTGNNWQNVTPVAPVGERARPFGPGYFPPPPPGAYAAAGISPAMMAPKPRSRGWITWVVGAVLLVFTLLAVGGVKLWRVFQTAGREEIVPLHDAMKRGDLAGIFAASDPAYQQDVGQERSNKLFTLIHDKMGDPVSYTVTNVNESTMAGGGTKKTLVLNTRFTKGYGQETLVFHKDAGVWKMIGYHCRSTLLKGHTENEK